MNISEGVDARAPSNALGGLDHIVARPEPGIREGRAAVADLRLAFANTPDRFNVGGNSLKVYLRFAHRAAPILSNGRSPAVRFKRAHD